VEPASPERPSGSFLSKAGPLVLARLFGAAITFCIPLVLARALPLEDYGTYKQLFLIAVTLYQVLPFGMAQSLYFFIPRSDEPRAFVAHALGFLTLAGAVGGTLVFTLSGSLASWFSSPGLSEHAGLLALYTACLIAASPLEISLTSQGRTRDAAFIYITSDLLRAAAMVVPILLGFGLRGAMLATTAFAAARLLATWVTLGVGTRGALFDRPRLSRQLAYALPFGAAMVLNAPQQFAHQYAVSAVVPPELFAIYAVGCFQLPLVDLLYTPASEVLMVRIGELERQQRLKESVLAFREAAGRLAYVFLPMAAFLFVAAPEFIAALFGPRFLDAVPLFRVSVAAVALATLPMDGALRARNQTRYLFFSYLVKALITVPLVWVGVTRFGMMGGILSWAGAELVGKGTLFARLPVALDIPERGLRRFTAVLPLRELGRAALAAAGAGGAVAALRLAVPAGVLQLPDDFVARALPLGVAGLIFTAGYLGLLRAWGIRPLVALAALRRGAA
jgi:O-antigen/teichoic acid export membrane protein